MLSFSFFVGHKRLEAQVKSEYPLPGLRISARSQLRTVREKISCRKEIGRRHIQPQLDMGLAGYGIGQRVAERQRAQAQVRSILVGERRMERNGD